MDIKRRIIIAVISGVCCLTSMASAQSVEHQWQEAKNISGNFKAVSSHPDIEVFSAPNMIMLKVSREVKVNVFSILGKLLSSQTLTPGIYQFEIESHGVYIIKTDETSCKIAI